LPASEATEGRLMSIIAEGAAAPTAHA
jgi:hypothetical protein